MTETIQLATNRFGEALICENCWSTETGTWRRSIGGTSILCNACGLFQRTKKKPRPAYLFGKTKRNSSNSNSRHNALAITDARRRTSPMVTVPQQYFPWNAHYGQQQQRPEQFASSMSAPDMFNHQAQMYHHNVYNSVSASATQLTPIAESPTLTMLNDALHRHQRRLQEEAVMQEMREIIASPIMTSAAEQCYTGSIVSPPIVYNRQQQRTPMVFNTDSAAQLTSMLLNASTAQDSVAATANYQHTAAPLPPTTASNNTTSTSTTTLGNQGMHNVLMNWATNTVTAPTTNTNATTDKAVVMATTSSALPNVSSSTSFGDFTYNNTFYGTTH